MSARSQRRRSRRSLAAARALLAEQRAALDAFLLEHRQRIPRLVEDDLWALLTQLRHAAERVDEELAASPPASRPQKERAGA